MHARRALCDSRFRKTPLDIRFLLHDTLATDVMEGDMRTSYPDAAASNAIARCLTSPEVPGA